MDGQKVQLDIRKHGGGLMMLVIVFVISGKYGRSGDRKTSKKKYPEGIIGLWQIQ